MDNYAMLVLALLINLVMTTLIVLKIYLPSEKDKGYVLTFFAFNLSIFMIATLFSQVEISLGFGFGIFAQLEHLTAARGIHCDRLFFFHSFFLLSK